MEQKTRKLGPDHTDTLMVAMNLATVAKEHGDDCAAESAFAANLGAKMRVLGADHADTCFAALNLVAVWVDGGYADRHAEAQELLERTHATLVRRFGEDHPSSLTAAMHKGGLLYALGQHANGVALLRSVLAAQVAAHGDAHPAALETVWRLGSLLAQPQPGATDPAGALALLRSTAAHLTRQLGEEHPRTLRSLVSLGEALVAVGDGAGGGDSEGGAALEADRLWTRVEAAQRAVLDPRHPELVKTQSLLRRRRLRVSAALPVIATTHTHGH